MIDEELKIWAAGLFDGEGSALIERTGTEKSPSYQFTVCTSTTSPEIASRVMENWDGHHRANRNLNLYHHKDNSVRRLDYSVYFSRDEARTFLEDILPYVVTRRRRIVIVLEALGKVPGEAELARMGKSRAPHGLGETLKPYCIQLKGLP